MPLPGQVSVPLALLAGVPSQDGGLEPCETAHYEVRAAPGEPDAQEIGRLLEAAWSQHGERFEPREGDRFRVLLLADAEAWADRVRAEGGELPYYSDGMLYRFETETVYAYRDPRAYLTRWRVLFGARQQSFAAVSSKRRNAVESWYARGLAARFADHVWDGRELVTSAELIVSGLDLLPESLEELSGTRLDAFSVESLTLAGSWGVTRYLMDGGREDLRKRFEKLALGRTGSLALGRDLSHVFGRDLAEGQGAVRAWLEARAPVFDVLAAPWEQTGPRDLVARAPRHVALCRLARPARALEASIALGREGEALPDPAAAGIAFGMDAQGRSSAVVLRLGSLSVQRRVEGARAETLGSLSVAVEPGEPVRVRVVADGDTLHVEAAGERLGPFSGIEPGDLGLFCDRATASFRGLRWE